MGFSDWLYTMHLTRATSLNSTPGFNLNHTNIGKRRASIVLLAALTLLIAPLGIAQSQRQFFPAPESTRSCSPALALAGTVAGKVDPREVLRYAIYAVNICRKEIGDTHPVTLNAMNNLANAYGVAGEFEKALVLFDQTLIQRRAMFGEDFPDTLESMSGLGNAYLVLGQPDKALPLFEIVLKKKRARVGEDYPDTLIAKNNLARTYVALGQPALALPLFEQVLKIRKALSGESHSDTLSATSDLANALFALGQFDGVLALQDQILKRSRATLGEDHLSTISAMSDLATTYRAMGQHEKALALGEQTFRLVRAKFGDDHPLAQMTMSAVASTYSARGEHMKALVIQENVLRLVRAQFGDVHPATLETANNLANTYGSLGQFDKALALRTRTLKLMQSKLGIDHPTTLSAMNSLAASYSAIGQHDDARLLIDQTLSLARTKLGVDHPTTLLFANNLAYAYRELGQPEVAADIYEQGIKLMQGKLGESNPSTLTAVNNLATTYGDLGRHEKARVLKEQTLKLRQATLFEDHPYTLLSMQSLASTYSDLGQYEKALALQQQTLVVRRTKLGNAHPDTLKSMDSVAFNYDRLSQLDKALLLIPEIVRGAENLRASNLSDENRQSLFASYANDYQRYSSLYAKHNRLNEGFNIGDLSKARTLTEGIKAQSAQSALSPSDLSKLLDAQAKVTNAQKSLDRVSEQVKPTPEALLTVQKAFDAAQIELTQLIAEIKTRNSRYGQLTDIKPAKVADAKELLSVGDGFVSYLIQKSGAAQAYVVGKNTPLRWIDLGLIANVSSSVAAYRELTALSTESGASGKLVEFRNGGYRWILASDAAPKESAQITDNPAIALLTLNKYFHDKLIKHILPTAGRFNRWIISPDKDLALLPFDNLAEEFDATGKVTATIAQKRTTTFVQSFAVFALLKKREADYAKLRRSKELFAMGNAVYSEGWAQSRGANRSKSQVEFRTTDQTLLDRLRGGATLKERDEQHAMRNLVWQNLPGTGREVSAVSSVFETQNKNTVDTLVGEGASESKLIELNRTGALQNYRYLLFSAHGYLAQNPALSALVLSQTGNAPDVDGYVTAGEWSLYDLKSDLTVLSACDTGVGKTQAGEGVMGLPYALFVAGNKNTLLTLWPVDDDATAEFMRTFFTKLKAGASQANALAETKRAFMRSPDWSQPRFWAAFVLYGV